VTLDATTLIDAFLALDTSDPPRPEAYFPGASQLIVDGMTFTGSGNVVDGFFEANIDFAGSGQNITLMRCAFTEQNTDE
jgi:hypothetical protein